MLYVYHHYAPHRRKHAWMLCSELKNESCVTGRSKGTALADVLKQSPSEQSMQLHTADADLDRY